MTLRSRRLHSYIGHYGTRVVDSERWQDRGEWAIWVIWLDRIATLALAAIVTSLLAVLILGRVL